MPLIDVCDGLVRQRKLFLQNYLISVISWEAATLFGLVIFEHHATFVGKIALAFAIDPALLAKYSREYCVSLGVYSLMLLVAAIFSSSDDSDEPATLKD